VDCCPEGVCLTLKNFAPLLVLAAVYGGLASCDRPEISAADLDYRIELISPDPAVVITSDTLKLSFRVVPDDSLGFNRILVRGREPVFSGGRYITSIPLTPADTSVTLYVELFLDDGLRIRDSVTFLHLKLRKDPVLFSMVHPRAGHSTTAGPDGKWYSTGGVPGWFDPALNSTESFDATLRISSAEPGYSLQNGRAGHGSLFLKNSQTLVVFGGGPRLYQPDRKEPLLPFELIAPGQPTRIQAQNLITREFAWDRLENKIFLHGGYSASAFYRLSASEDSVRTELTKPNGYSLDEHTMNVLPAAPDFLFLGAGYFEFYDPLMYSFYISAGTGRFYLSDIFYQELRKDHASAKFGSRFLIISGGYLQENGTRRLLSSLEIIDPESGRTYRFPDTLSTARAAHTMVTSGKDIWVLGGWNPEQQVITTIEHFYLAD